MAEVKKEIAHAGCHCGFNPVTHPQNFNYDIEFEKKRHKNTLVKLTICKFCDFTFEGHKNG